MNQTFPLTLSTHTTSQRIAFIQGHWHQDIVEKAYEAFIAEVERCGLNAEQVDTFTVSGAYEIPLQAKILAQSGRYGAIVGAGFVVDGGIYPHDFVAPAVIAAVLTPHHFHEHATHHDFYTQHFVTKGKEAAQACLNTMENLHRARKLSEA